MYHKAYLGINKGVLENIDDQKNHEKAYILRVSLQISEGSYNFLYPHGKPTHSIATAGFMVSQKEVIGDSRAICTEWNWKEDSLYSGWIYFPLSWLTPVSSPALKYYAELGQHSHHTHFNLLHSPQYFPS
jgi:hypothetical protein